jgi:protein phosphatase
MAGAAASVSDPRLSTDGTAPASSFGVIDNHLENHFRDSYDGHGRSSTTAPQPMVAVDEMDPAAMPLAVATENGADPRTTGPRRSHRAQPKRARRSGRRRWPIVTTSLVVLVAVIIGGGYIAWRWSQDQYYVAADSKGEVVIYRGVNTQFAGISLSKPYRLTGIQLTQVPAPYQQTVKAVDQASSLGSAQKIVANISAAVSACLQQYTALRDWVTKDHAYQAALARAKLARQAKKPVNSIPPNPGPRPPKAGAMCPPSTAYSIPASALAPATGHS